MVVNELPAVRPIKAAYEGGLPFSLSSMAEEAVDVASPD